MDDGLVMKVQIYSGMKLTDTESLGQTGSIVLHLMERYLDKGYHLFTDNWYNSVSLTECMSKRNTYITGTLRADQKQNPSEVMRKKLQKGEMAFMSLDDISVTKWRDKRDVHVISNAHVPMIIDSVNRRGKSKRKPNVDIYNALMSGIDRSDQMLSYHSALLKKKTLWPLFMDGVQLPQGLEPLRGGSLLFTTKFPEVPGTHSIDLGRMKG